MDNIFFQNAIKQISIIKWDYNSDRTVDECEKDLLLVKEYFRRLKIFIDYLSVIIKYPFIDPVKQLNKEPKIEYDDVEKICPNIKEIGGISKSICVLHVLLNSVIDESDPVTIRFKDIFEPLIILFQRGGHWGTHHGILVVSHKLICLLSDWRSLVPNETIDLNEYKFLDK